MPTKLLKFIWSVSSKIRNYLLEKHFQKRSEMYSTKKSSRKRVFLELLAKAKNGIFASYSTAFPFVIFYDTLEFIIMFMQNANFILLSTE